METWATGRASTAIGSSTAAGKRPSRVHRLRKGKGATMSVARARGQSGSKKKETLFVYGRSILSRKGGKAAGPPPKGCRNTTGRNTPSAPESGKTIMFVAAKGADCRPTDVVLSAQMSDYPSREKKKKIVFPTRQGSRTPAKTSAGPEKGTVLHGDHDAIKKRGGGIACRTKRVISPLAGEKTYPMHG